MGTVQLRLSPAGLTKLMLRLCVLAVVLTFVCCALAGVMFRPIALALNGIGHEYHEIDINCMQQECFFAAMRTFATLQL